MSGTEATQKRITVNLGPSDLERMEAIAAETNLSANEILRRALATESFIRENRRAGAKVLIEDEDGTLTRVELLY